MHFNVNDFLCPGNFCLSFYFYSNFNAVQLDCTCALAKNGTVGRCSLCMAFDILLDSRLEKLLSTATITLFRSDNIPRDAKLQFHLVFRFVWSFTRCVYFSDHIVVFQRCTQHWLAFEQQITVSSEDGLKLHVPLIVGINVYCVPNFSGLSIPLSLPLSISRYCHFHYVEWATNRNASWKLKGEYFRTEYSDGIHFLVARETKTLLQNANFFVNQNLQSITTAALAIAIGIATPSTKIK